MTSTQIRNYLKANGFDRRVYQNRLTYYTKRGLNIFIENNIKSVTIVTDLENFSDLDMVDMDSLKRIHVGEECVTFESLEQIGFKREYVKKFFDFIE